MTDTPRNRTVRLRIVETSDVHGSFFAYDFVRRRPTRGSLARVDAYVQRLRSTYGSNLLLLDNGDILQGQPPAYYYNFLDATAPMHPVAEMMNYMRYDAGNVGNHDIETGRRVVDRWTADCRFPILGANIIETATGKPRFTPYTVFERDGVRIAVLGMITPAVPMWVSAELWQGLQFDDMEQTARRWMPVLRGEERADIVIGLFHSGTQAVTVGNGYREHAAVEVAQHVPGFDIVLCGHNHYRECFYADVDGGGRVLVVNPSNAANVVGDVSVTCTLHNGRVTGKTIEGRLESVADTDISPMFMQQFAFQFAAVERFVSHRIGRLTCTISASDAYFGPSAFVDIVHRVQLEITGADISMASPLSYNAVVHQGSLCMSDMFSLYKYENTLYTLDLTGREILGYVEHSYSLWIDQMLTPEDHVLLVDKDYEKTSGHPCLVNPMFNFDSAAGIIYTVDVTKPTGHKVSILSMADGSAFDPDRHYTVTVNSYRGSGGGEHLTKGAGIASDELRQRIIAVSKHHLRYYLAEYVKRHHTINPRPLNQWKLVPEEWVRPAAERDRRLLFSGI